MRKTFSEIRKNVLWKYEKNVLHYLSQFEEEALRADVSVDDMAVPVDVVGLETLDHRKKILDNRTKSF